MHYIDHTRRAFRLTRATPRRTRPGLRTLGPLAASLTRAAVVALLLALFASTSLAYDFVAFGPRQYVRGTGRPAPVTQTFAVTNTATPYVLRIDSTGVSSAYVTLNGVEVFKPSDFNANVRVLTKNVTLLANNTLTVELHGKPGESMSLQLIGEEADTTPPLITPSVSPAPNAAGWNNSNPTVTFNCSDAGSNIANCTAPTTITDETGGTVVVGTAVDNAGNSASVSVTVKLDKTAPNIAGSVSPAPNAAGWNNDDPTASFACSDDLSGTASCSAPVTVTDETGGRLIVGNAVDLAGNAATASVTVKLDKTAPNIVGSVSPAPNAAGWNNTDPTASFICTDASSGVADCTGPVVVSAETTGQVVSGSAVDAAGNTASASVAVKLDKTPPSLSLTSPAPGSNIFTSPVMVGGSAADALSGFAGVTCNGTPAVVEGNVFNCGVPLTPGANSVAAVATDVAGNSNTATLPLTYKRAPAVTFTSPVSLGYLNISPTTVTGTVDDPTATVTVNSVEAAVAGGQFSVALPLAEGPNVITATATTATGAVGTASIEVTLDTTPPRVTLNSPPDQFVTTDATVSVSGSVNDIVVGTVNSEQAQVTVNGVAADVANRTFLATDVPLNLGPNVIQAVGRDRVGNAATTQITVTRQAAAQAQIHLVSGNNQTNVAGSVLVSPLVVAVTDAAGAPVPNKQVIFKVTQNDGALSPDGGPPAPTVVATTDAQGRAQVLWKLGMRAGAGGNRAEAYAVGFEGTAIFTATGTQGQAGNIVVDTGGDQIGAVSQALPKPFIAVVVDGGHNRLAGVPVTFTVRKGGGSFDGQPTYTVNTDSDGRAAATLTLGMQEGNANNVVEADFPQNLSAPATFAASARAPGDPTETTISGVVLDNSNAPIPGVTLRAVLTTALNTNLSSVLTAPSATTDAQGQFIIRGAPVGSVDLFVDGSTAQRPGVFPTLDYDLVTVAGRDNTVGMPIYLLPLATDNKLCVTATNGGGTLTIPEAPGFALSFGPGQVTFPGGTREGCISATVVHGDKVPMVPGFGQQPRFIVTIQPSGALFNQPASITLPNVDGLRPRAVTEMYSFDHDIGSFVAIGTGTVSDDGLTIRSNPGVGVLKAGWHCGGDPNSSGSAAPLSLTVTPDKAVVAIGEEFELTAAGAPPKDGVYEWTPGGNVTTVSAPNCAGAGTCPGKFKGATSGTENLKVCFRCTTTGAVTCKDVAVTVIKIELKKLSFKTDHGMMRDNNSNYEATGSVFTKPDWDDAGKNNPISHTMNQNVGVDLEFLVTPADAPSRSYNIKGTGPTGLNYEGTIDLGGGTQVKALTSTDKIENKVQKLGGSINWEVKFNNASVHTKSTGSHTVYVTMGTPRNDGTTPGTVTQKRMERAVQQVAAAASLDPHSITKKVIQAQGNFDLNAAQSNEWVVPDTGGDCQSIVRFTKAVLDMIDVPGTILHRNVYARETAPTVGIEVPGTHGGLNTDVRWHPNGIWSLALMDGSTPPGCNAFEATAKFTHNGITKYYAGGTLGVFDNPNQVLTVFQSLSWVAGVGTPPVCTIMQVVHSY